MAFLIESLRILKTRWRVVSVSAVEVDFIMVSLTPYPVPYGFVFESFGMATDSSYVTVLLNPSIAGSIRSEKTCW